MNSEPARMGETEGAKQAAESPSRSGPVVTVVIPTYNREHLIGQTLRSIEGQTFPDWECLVVDDGSTDDTAAVVAGFSARDSRFRYIRQDNSGVATARNRGIAEARGRYIALLDSDDAFTPDRLAWQVEAMEKNADAVLVYGQTWQYRESDPDSGRLRPDAGTPPFEGDGFEHILLDSTLYAPLVRARTIREVGGFDPDVEYGEDWEMWLRLARAGTTVFQPRVSTLYRIHGGNRSGFDNDRSGNSYREYRWAWRIVERHIAALPLYRRLRLRRALRKNFRHGYTARILGDMLGRLAARDLAGAVRIGASLVALNIGGPRPLIGVFAQALSARLGRRSHQTGALPSELEG